MATKNVTNLNAPVALTCDQVRAKLTDADALTQSASDAIVAAAKGARALLALDAGALDHVRHLLDVIVVQADGLQNDVNALAEQAGANWIDKRDREASARLWEQHRLLHGKPIAGSLQ